MAKMGSTTFFNEALVKRTVHGVAEEIRSFLAFVNDPKMNSSYRSLKQLNAAVKMLSVDVRQMAKLYKVNPDRFSDDRLLKLGVGIKKAVKNFVRIEVRQSKDVSGAAQVVAKGIEGDFRSIALRNLRRRDCFKANEMSIKLAGRSSIEFNVGGVDKGLPFRYFECRLGNVLRKMQYAPGKRINVYDSRTIIAADADGTIMGGPTLTKIPKLIESPARDSIDEFLSLGGLFIVISGNNLERTEMRLRSGIKKRFRNRVVIVGNGGASMAVYGKDGYLDEIKDYRLHALNLTKQKGKKESLDVIYVGNDGHPFGNDMEGFKEVGFSRSFLVEKKKVKVALRLKKQIVPGNEEATAKILEVINKEVCGVSRARYFTPQSITKILRGVQ